MTKTTNAAGIAEPAANEKSRSENLNQDYTVNPDKSKEGIHRIPIHLHRQPNQLPAVLKQLHQWCLSGHDKTPLTAAGCKMDVTNPSNYLSFDEATAAAKLTCAAGVGFVLTGSNVVVIDIDHCYQNEKFSQLAMELMESLPTYAELSQSQTGLHLIYLDNNIPADFTGRKGAIEIYADKRYIALTGWKITDSTADLAVLNGMTRRLLDTYFPNTGYNSSADFQTILEQHSYPPVQSDDQVLQSLQSNQKFQQLFYQGDISGYPSQSEADGALMLILATATALNAPQMRRLFSQSALGKRGKWVNRVWYQDYLITGAIRFAESKENGEMNNKWAIFDSYFSNQILEDVQRYFKYANRETGFANLDAQHKFFAPGLYVLGGISGMGKTTFAWQLCEQLAKYGEPIIYISYEMSRLDLYSKSVSRRLREKIIAGKIPANQQLSSIEFKSGLSNIGVSQILNELTEEHLPISVYSADETDTIEKITQLLSNKISECQIAPVVVVDYLQIIPHTENNIKLGIDKAVTQLKNFQRDTNTTFILISSISRAFYDKPLTFEALKESGGIEYSADVIWGLQFPPKSSAENKQQIPRVIQLVALKNRMGNDYSVTFDYYPDSDLFVPSETNWDW